MTWSRRDTHHRVNSCTDAHVCPSRGSEVIVSPLLETSLQYESALAVCDRDLVDEVLNVDRNIKLALSIFEAWSGILSWHILPDF